METVIKLLTNCIIKIGIDTFVYKLMYSSLNKMTKLQINSLFDILMANQMRNYRSIYL